MARPTIYTTELADKICEKVAKQSLNKVTKDKGMPDISTIFRWLVDEDKKEFCDKYEKACDERTEHMFEEINEISDNTKGEVQRDRLRVDTRKWYLSKMKPKKYGDKVDFTSGGKRIPFGKIDEILRDNSNKEDTGAETED